MVQIHPQGRNDHQSRHGMLCFPLKRKNEGQYKQQNQKESCAIVYQALCGRLSDPVVPQQKAQHSQINPVKSVHSLLLFRFRVCPNECVTARESSGHAQNGRENTKSRRKKRGDPHPSLPRNVTTEPPQGDNRGSPATPSDERNRRMILRFPPADVTVKTRKNISAPRGRRSK